MTWAQELVELREQLSCMVPRDVADELAKRLGVLQAEMDAKAAEAQVLRLAAKRLESELDAWKAAALAACSPCFSCGKRDFVPAVDNTGAVYLGCSHCTVVLSG